MTIQIVREWPPGFGGVERVAHEISCINQAAIFSFDANKDIGEAPDPLSVPYKRVKIPCIRLSRFVLPLPSASLFMIFLSGEPMVLHLPCPTICLIGLCAKLLQPKRRVVVYWHAFLACNFSIAGNFYSFYQWFAVNLAKIADEVVTTSPPLVEELVQYGCKPERTRMLPCCIPEELEQVANSSISFIKSVRQEKPLQILFIGRLDSYKRVDWLLGAAKQAVNHLKITNPNQEHLTVHIVGDGPRRLELEKLSLDFCMNVNFHGRISESEKMQRLSNADILVLPSDRPNEAFGIVQLEAMAFGVLSLALSCRQSGMHWVCDVPGLKWNHTLDELPQVFLLLARDRSLCAKLSKQARERYEMLFSRNQWRGRLNAIHL